MVLMDSAGFEDGWRDGLAILAAGLRDDPEGIATVVDNGDPACLISALAGMVIDVLHEHGTDPAEWVADRQERAREELRRA